MRVKNVMKQVTRDIDLDAARDLIERVPRARLAFAINDRPHALPVRFEWRDGHYLMGIHKGTQYLPQPGQEVALLIDEGVYYFELRAVYIRGQVQPVEAPSGASAEYAWFEVDISKITAWDYGSMREV